MAFEKEYVNEKDGVGFESDEGETWVSARLEPTTDHRDGGVYIDKSYIGSEPCLSVEQARLFATKILAFCELLRE